MLNKRIRTSLGEISVSFETVPSSEPMVFLHGLFLDNSLWSGYESHQTGRSHFFVDMPAHGESSDVGRPWGQNECSRALIEVLDQLHIERCCVIGHSWGAITALQASAMAPTRFSALGLFNMPFRKPSTMQMLGFHLQKLLALFPTLYGRAVANALFTRDFLTDHGECGRQIESHLRARPWLEVIRAIDAVMIGAMDLMPLIRASSVPLLLVCGREDHVGVPPGDPCREVAGGHVSPWEVPLDTLHTVMQLAAAGHGGREKS